jgi:haloalkane dehalogenase
MGQDWGGPIGIAVASSNLQRVSGLTFGNTWFWPTDRMINRLFSKVMSTSLLQSAITDRNLFVERIMPVGLARPISDEVMDQYRGAQPNPEMRRGVAEFPRQLTAANDWLAELETAVRRNLCEIPLLLVWGSQDFAFPPKSFVPRWRESFRDHVLVELPHAKHYFQEDAPAEVVMAIKSRFEP